LTKQSFLSKVKITRQSWYRRSKPTNSDAKTEEIEQRAEVTEGEAANKLKEDSESDSEKSKSKFNSTLTELSREEFMTQLMEQLRTFLK
jgi:hypothetical protein